MTTTFDKHFGSQERVKAVQRMRCLVCSKTPCQNAHVVSRGAGGTYKDIVPLCAYHHREQHQLGTVTFAKKYDLNLKECAVKVAAHLDT